MTPDEIALARRHGDRVARGYCHDRDSYRQLAQTTLALCSALEAERAAVAGLVAAAECRHAMDEYDNDHGRLAYNDLMITLGRLGYDDDGPVGMRVWVRTQFTAALAAYKALREATS